MDNDYQEEDNILQEKDCSTTFVKEIKTSCQWTIYNFSFFVQGEKTGSMYAPDIESSLFQYGCNNDLLWDINIVNLRDPEEEYLKLYLYVNDVEWHDYLSIQAKVSILDDKGKEAHTIKFKPEILSTDSVNLIKKDYLMNKNNMLLTNDKLVIVCEINASAEVYTYSWNASEESDNEDEIHSADIFKSRLKVSQDLQALVQNDSGDSIITVKKKQYHVHKCILAARSRVFSAMFEQKMLEQANNTVVIKDINNKVFEDVIDFIYFGELRNINDIGKDLLEILVAADKYELSGLKEICEYIFSTKLLLSNAVEMLNLADFYHADKLKKCIVQFIIAHNQDFINNKKFDSLLNSHSHLIPYFLQEKSKYGKESLDLSDDSDDEDQERGSCIHHVHLPPTNSSVEEKQWSVTQICTDNGSCTWKIHQVNLLFNNDMTECIISDKFSKDNNSNLSWQLFLYFKGINNDTKDYISLMILFSNGNTSVDKIHAQYEFAILDGNGEVVNKMTSSLLTFTVNHTKLGESKFIKRDLLFNKKKNFLQDNNLVIICTVTFGLNINKVYKQSNVLTYCKHKYLLAVSDDLENLLKSGKLSDITVIVSGKKFLLHRAILASRSPLMLKMINELFEKQKKAVLELNDIDQADFAELLLFIYSGKLNNLKQLAKSLYTEANRFQLEVLKSICETYLCKNLTLENVCDNFVFAHVNNVRKLREKCNLFITDNLKAVLNTAGYKSLTESRPRLLKDLLIHRQCS